MRAETSMFAKQHMEYLKSDPSHSAEMQTYDTIYDHFYYYLTSVRGLIPSTAQAVVTDFKKDLKSQKD